MAVFNIDSEKTIIAYLLIKPEAIQDAMFYLKNGGYFYENKHKVMYDIMLKNKQDEILTDIGLILNEIEKRHKDQANNYAVYITNLLEDFCEVINFDKHCEIIKDCFIQRSLQRIENFIGDSIRKNEETHTILGSLRQKLDVLEKIKANEQKLSFPERLETYFLELCENARNPQKTFLLDTGMDQVDKLIGGLGKATLNILAGRPGSCKTATSLEVIHHLAVKKMKSFFISLEMSEKNLVYRMLCKRTKIEGDQFKKYEFTDEELELIYNHIEVLKNDGIRIDDEQGLNIFDIILKAKKVFADEPYDLLVIDYLGMINPTPEYRGQSKPDMIGAMSRKLKELSKFLDIPILLLCQVNRDCENRPNKRPGPSDLRDSGQIEQAADLILFTYRDELYYPEGNITLPGYEQYTNEGALEIIVAKQRNGSLGTALQLADLSTMNIGKFPYSKDNGDAPFKEEDYEYDFSGS